MYQAIAKQVVKKAKQKFSDKKKKKGEGTTSNNAAEKNNTGRKQNMKGASTPSASDVAPDIAQQNKPDPQPLKGKPKRMEGTAVEQVGTTPGPVRDYKDTGEPYDVTLNQLANMPEGTDVQGASLGGIGGLREPPETPTIESMVGGQTGEPIGQTMVPQDRDQTPVNADTHGDIPADLMSEVPDTGDDRNRFQKLWDETPPEEQVAPDMTPVDQRDFEGADAQTDTAPRRGVIEDLDLPGQEQIPLSEIPVEGGLKGGELERDVTPIDAGSEERKQFERTTTPEDIKEAQEAGVDRPSYWKVALASLLGGMPLIPGSSLAAEPLRRAREDYRNQTAKDKELTDIFLKEMGSGDWKGAQQLARTAMFRDAVTRTMKMTPDDLINLDKSIQENSAYTLSDAIGLAKKAKDAGLDPKVGGTSVQIPGVGTYEARQPEFKQQGGLFYRTDPDTGELIIAKDKEKEQQDMRIKALMEEGMTYSEAVLAEQRVGKGVPRFSQTVVGNGVVTSLDQFSGNVVKYKFADAIKSNTAIEIFKDISGIPIGYFLYDKNKPVPTDMTKVTPVFFKNTLWGDQSKGRWTWYDQMRRVKEAVEQKEGGFLNWISSFMGGMDVTDNTPHAPQGDEAADYSQGTYIESSPAQQAPTAPVSPTPDRNTTKQGSTAKPTVGADADKDQRKKVNKFLDITGEI